MIVESPLATYRRKRGLSQAKVAAAIGLRSKGHVSDLERGRVPITLKLALRIQKWSDGEVKAAELCPDAADLVDQLGDQRGQARTQP